MRIIGGLFKPLFFYKKKPINQAYSNGTIQMIFYFL